MSSFAFGASEKIIATHDPTKYQPEVVKKSSKNISWLVNPQATMDQRKLRLLMMDILIQVALGYVRN